MCRSSMQRDQKRERDTHDLNSHTRKSPGKLQTRVAHGKYLLFPKTMCLCGYRILRSNLMAVSWKAAPSTQPRSSPRWWAGLTETGEPSSVRRLRAGCSSLLLEVRSVSQTENRNLAGSHRWGLSNRKSQRGCF